MKRIASLDYARGFTVLLMAPVHTVLLYSNDSTREGPLGIMISFLAENHGAPVLMTLMGASIALKTHQKIHEIILRSAALFLLAYLLNILKFLFPLTTVGLPAAFLNDIEIPAGNEGIIQLILIGDIFHFAALATLIVSLVAKIKNSLSIAPVAIIIVLALSFLLNQPTNPLPINTITRYFFAGPPQVYFPVFPWLIYPLVGLAIGSALHQKIPGFSSRILGFAILFCSSGIIGRLSGIHSVSFYQPGIADAVLQMGVVMLCLCVWHWISDNIPANRFLSLLQWLGKHITLTYCLQWIIICWAFPFVGYHRLNVPQSLLAVTLTTTAKLMLTALTTKIRFNAKNI